MYRFISQGNNTSIMLQVFVGLVRPTSETFASESRLESFRMEYRTRHSIDGEIIECESRIALVTGYMTHEVNGVNAMNFMHRDDVRWVIIALRESECYPVLKSKLTPNCQCTNKSNEDKT